MGYRIRVDEPTDIALRRVVGEQLDKAAAALRVPGGPDAAAVHEVRRRLKKARSAVRLGRADLGPTVARHANAELRDVGAALATQRDADALVEAVDGLLDPAGPSSSVGGPTVAPGPSEALRRVRAELVARADRVRVDGALGRATVLGAARTVEQTANWIRRLPAHEVGWDGLGPGFTREYRRGQRAHAALGPQPTVDDLHEWRKRVKDLWYHQRLLRDLWPEAQRPIIDAADALAQALGDDRDLGLLAAHLAPAGTHAVADVRALTAPVEPLEVAADVRSAATSAVVDARAVLQDRARRLGAHLYADGPPAWGERHGAWWAAAAADTRRDHVSEGVPAVVAEPSPDGVTA